MGEENKKSFWTSLPGILTGVAAIIAAITGIVVAYNPSSPSPSPASDVPTPTPSPQPSSIASPSQQNFACGEKLPEVILIGSWRWSGNVDDSSQSGVLTFKSDCTYMNVPKSGVTTKDEGQFLVNTTPSSITFTNKASGENHTYLISNISENSFHASSPDLTVNLDFFRAS